MMLLHIHTPYTTHCARICVYHACLNDIIQADKNKKCKNKEKAASTPTKMQSKRIQNKQIDATIQCDAVGTEKRIPGRRAEAVRGFWSPRGLPSAVRHAMTLQCTG